MMLTEGRRRVQIEGIYPEIDCGQFPIKRTPGEVVEVEADIFVDGHDAIAGVVQYRPVSSTHWQEVPLSPLVNDRWQGSFTVTEMGRYVYTVTAWVDHFLSWKKGMAKKLEVNQDVATDLLIGAEFIAEASQRAGGDDHYRLNNWVKTLQSLPGETPTLIEEKIFSNDLTELMTRYPDRRFATTYDKELGIVVDREKARFSAWYEFFPRSTAEHDQHGNFQTAQNLIPYVAELGFDVIYLPPIHPIGAKFRKGKNNSVMCEPDDVGVPWGIGATEGGHKAIHPLLGTLDDFREFVHKAGEHGMEVALDLAYQCSPDHPYVKEHPDWFLHRPDGTIQYAENPPKKYQDIYPINFESADWQSLWEELRSVVLFWVDQGVKIFRVDNPHTKALPFWEWMIETIKHDHPEVLFLAEAFTRPKVMYRLAKLGFTQSYTYFTWRNTKWELTEYFTELTQTPASDIFRPNVWPNTPDILHEYLQHGGRPAFVIRLVLAATLAASYGIYGPAYDVCENRPAKPGSEEYLNSEKYQIRDWDLNSPFTIRHQITRVNQIRRSHPALQSNRNLTFHQINNDNLIGYTKQTNNAADVMLMVVNLDPYHTQSGWLHLPLEALGINPDRPYHLYDLLNDTYYSWQGAFNYVALDPYQTPAHIFHITSG